MAPRKLIPAAIGACVLAAAILLGMQLGARQQGGPTPDAADALEVAASDAPTQPPSIEPTPSPAPAAASPEPLPPLDTPLADVFDDLAARAARGDHRAACRLAFEVDACQSDLARLRLTGRMAEGLANVDTGLLDDEQLLAFEQQVESTTRRLDARDALEARCAGVPEVSRARQAAWWRQSAMAGNREAARGYVTGEALPMDEWMQNLGAVEQMRRDIEPLAWRQMQGGDLTMAWHLMMAHAGMPSSPVNSVLSQAVQADPEQGLALAFYLREALPRATGPTEDLERYVARVDSWASQLGATLDEAQRARAEAQGRAWNRDIRPLDIPSEFSAQATDGPGWNDERLESCSEG